MTLIPQSVIGITAKIFGTNDTYTHSQLNSLFMSADFPGDPPTGNKIDKCIRWLRIANTECEDPLVMFGRLVAEFMDEIYQGAEFGDSEPPEHWVQKRQMIRDALEAEGFVYKRGGVIVDTGTKKSTNATVVPLPPITSKNHMHEPDNNEPRTTGKDESRMNENIKNRVFVVHGRNLKARDELFKFLRSISLFPIEWIQAKKMTKKASPYIGEILDAAFKNAQAVVVLMTGDDVAKLKDEFVEEHENDHEINLTPQARPNVLFEAGMSFGYHPDKTVLIELGVLRPFSDIGGRHTLKLDNTPQKRQALAQLLKGCGCEVDTSGELWYGAGDFEKCIIDFVKKKEVFKNEYEVNDTFDEEQMAIFKSLRTVEDSVTEIDLANELHFDIQKVKYHLEFLEKKDYIFSRHFYDGSRSEYGLNPKGREFLASKGLL